LKRFLELFFFFFFFSFLAPSLNDLGVLMIFEEKINSSKTSFQMASIYWRVDAYFRVELCMPTWLYHDYGDGRVVDILAVDAYPGVDVCTLIFIGEANN
jgi:hypothetical protein